MKELRALREEWNGLLGSGGMPVLRHEWFTSCIGAIHPESDLNILILRSQDKIKGIAPLVRARRHGVRWLTFIGVSALSEPCDLIYDSNESLVELLTHLRKLKVPLVLQRLPDESATAAALSQDPKSPGLGRSLSDSPSLYVPINSSWQTFTGTISSRRRYDLRRARRRAEKHGEVSVEILRPTPEEFQARLPDIFEVEAAGWKGRRGSAMLHKRSLGRFFSSYGARAAGAEMLTLSFLKIGEHIAAVQLGVEFDNRFWVLKIGYDERWASCSPGMQLTHEMVRYAFERELSAYELLGAEESWQSVWARERHGYSTVVRYPASPKGVWCYAADGLRRVVSRVRAV